MADHNHIEHIEEQAALYAVGALSPEEAKQFAQRLAADCPLCVAELQRCEVAVTALAMSVPQVAPSPRVRARLLAALPGKARKSAAIGEGTLVRANDSEWETTPVPGVRFRHLYEKKTLLVRMDPKSSFPAHEHEEAEQCLVLEGSVTSDGVTAYAGDYLYMPAGSHHNPLYSETGATFLIAYT